MTQTDSLVERLRASVRFDALNGDHHERSVCRKQMTEAASLIEQQARELAEAREEITRVKWNSDTWESQSRDLLRQKLERDALIERLRGALEKSPCWFSFVTMGREPVCDENTVNKCGRCAALQERHS